ncbi:hypothetical protein VTN96DRAFT_2575 [Rasamsonia emersonii]
MTFQLGEDLPERLKGRTLQRCGAPSRLSPSFATRDTEKKKAGNELARLQLIGIGLWLLCYYDISVSLF